MKPLAGDPAALGEGGKAMLARCLTALETDPGDRDLLRLLDACHAAPRGRAIGLTGPPGVGKSTLTRALVAGLRGDGGSVGVIAVDPSSRLTGGALLGDRTRIAADAADPGVFVRSMAARSRLGGLAALTFPALVLMRAVFDWVVIETVGVGQSESDVNDCADAVVLCVQPGAGDALQFMKAGVMEMPDLILVTKGDLGAQATTAAAEIAAALSLAGREGPAPGVTVVSAFTGQGVAAALERIRALAGRTGERSFDERRRMQARAWVEARIVDSFGRVGLDSLRSRLADLPAPFSGLADLSGVAQTQVHRALENI